MEARIRTHSLQTTTIILWTLRNHKCFPITLLLAQTSHSRIKLQSKIILILIITPVKAKRIKALLPQSHVHQESYRKKNIARTEQRRDHLRYENYARHPSIISISVLESKNCAQVHTAATATIRRQHLQPDTIAHTHTSQNHKPQRIIQQYPAISQVQLQLSQWISSNKLIPIEHPYNRFTSTNPNPHSTLHQAPCFRIVPINGDKSNLFTTISRRNNNNNNSRITINNSKKNNNNNNKTPKINLRTSSIWIKIRTTILVFKCT